MSYYLQETGKEFVSQQDTPNRVRDANRVGAEYGLSEEGNDHREFWTKNGTLIARGYLRVVYGDHGPYVEFLPKHMVASRKVWQRVTSKGPKAYYDEFKPVDGSTCKLYWQLRPVTDLRNPPAGKYSKPMNRAGGYADYRAGRVYISPDDFSILNYGYGE